MCLLVLSRYTVWTAPPASASRFWFQVSYKNVSPACPAGAAWEERCPSSSSHLLPLNPSRQLANRWLCPRVITATSTLFTVLSPHVCRAKESVISSCRLSWDLMMSLVNRPSSDTQLLALLVRFRERAMGWPCPQSWVLIHFLHLVGLCQHPAWLAALFL